VAHGGARRVAHGKETQVTERDKIRLTTLSACAG
jgi:hypothetical protein